MEYLALAEPPRAPAALLTSVTEPRAPAASLTSVAEEHELADADAAFQGGMDLGSVASGDLMHAGEDVTATAAAVPTELYRL